MHLIAVVSLVNPILDSSLERAALGAFLALGVALAAYAVRSLDRSGVIAATLCGTLAAAAGWPWAVLLVAYFVASSLVSRAGRDAKEARAGSVTAKGGRRDASQVLANGGVFALAAAASVVSGSRIWVWGGLGALAASAADTWSTEIGLLWGGVPRSIIGRTIVRPGESGGVTGVGSLGGLAGAALVAACAALLGFPPGAALASLGAGFGGALVDSILGETVQERRFCDGCSMPTERTVHGCGHPTRRIGGIRSLDNDVVNALATLAGFAIGIMTEIMWTRGLPRGMIG